MFVVTRNKQKIAEIYEMPISVNKSLTDSILNFPTFTMEIKNANNIEQLYSYLSAASPSSDTVVIWDCITGEVKVM